jgi:oligopeptide transport system substrate-binding protein
MLFNPRNIVIWIALLVLVAGVAWAVSFSPEPPAGFTFVNGTEVQSVDPAIVTGQPEGRIIDCLFEGLTRWDPDTLKPLPGVAESWDISADKKTYTFHFRKDARWSDGSPVTAADFVWSHRRLLDPSARSEYSYILWMVKNARKYNTLRVDVGDPVEVELNRKPDGVTEFARGEIIRGRLVSAPPPLKDSDEDTGDKKKEAAAPRDYVVDVDGKQRTFKAGSGPDEYKQVMLDFDQVGLHALDEHTYQVTLEDPTAYFLQVTGMFPTYPVNHRCLETYGFPGWVRPENLVSDGPYRLESRKIREKMRLSRSDTYWGRDEVHVQTIDALVVESDTTALNLYLTGKVDWIPTVPPTIVKDLLDAHRDDFHPLPEFTIVFYRLNVTKEPLKDVRVRRALNMATNKQEIVDGVTRAGEVPARSLVPPVIRRYMNYASAQCEEYNPKEAARLLAEAGFPGAFGNQRIPILTNSANESRKLVAELVQRQWKQNLGIDVDLQAQEWGAYLSAQSNLEFSIATAGWIGDYVDPNTFLDMFVTGGQNNQTGWSNLKYDELIRDAAREPDVDRRLKMLHDAEQILMDELPIIPLYVSVTRNMVRPYVHGFYENVLDDHPLGRISVDAAAQAKSRREGFR